eukprot:4488469-Amphidinium_carterae.1
MKIHTSTVFSQQLVQLDRSILKLHITCHLGQCSEQMWIFVRRRGDPTSALSSIQPKHGSTHFSLFSKLVLSTKTLLDREVHLLKLLQKHFGLY